MADGNTLTERVSFEVTAPYSAAKLKGFNEAIARMERMQVVWNRLQSSMTAMSAPVVIRKSMQDVLASMEKAGGRAMGLKGISLKPEQLAKQLVLPVQQFQNYLQQALLGGSSRELKAIQARARKAFSENSGQFRNARAAAQWVSYYTQQYPKAANPYEVMQKVFGAAPSGGAAPAAQAATAANFGQRMAEAKAKKSSGEHSTANIQHSTPNAGEVGAASKAKEFAQKRAQIERDLAESLTAAQGKPGESLTGSAQRQIGSYRRAAAQMRGLAGDEPNLGLASKRANDALKWAANQEKKSIQLAQAQSLAAGKNISETREALSAAKERGDKTEQKRLQREVKSYQKQQAKFEAMQDLGRQGGSEAMIAQQAAMGTADERINKRLEERRAVDKSHADARKYAEELKARGAMQVGGRIAGGSKPERQVFEWDEGGLRRQATINYGRDGADISHRNLRPEKAAQTRWQSAVQGLSVSNMAANILKVTEWAAAVAVLYKSVELLRYSLKRMEDTGMEMAHLSIVFRGVGGDVAELTGDMIKLASAQGRSTDETMQSAVEWARLGGDRATINEEVRVSAEAANIANMHMGETTKQLMSLMHVYNMESGDLQGTLGGLVNTSLKYNVTLEEMFTGLDRSAAAAKVAGVGLAELQAMIAVVVGSTGATGSMTGNSLKYIFQELPKAGVQRQLRGLGIEPMGNGLEQKPAGQLLSELAVKWGTLGSGAQQQLSTTLGGRFNAARVPIVLEKYPEILRLAIDEQLNLNKAQEANAKILETLKAKLAGVRAEWDQFMVKTNLSPVLAKWIDTGRYLMRDIGAAIGPLDTDAAKKTREATMKHGMDNSPWSWRRLSATAVATGNSLASLYTLGGWSYFHPQGAGLTDYYNYNNQMAERRDSQPAGQEAYETKLSGLKGNIGANALRVQQFNLALGRLQNGTMSQGDANNIAQVMQGMDGTHGQAMASAFLAARQRGDKAGAMDVAKRARDQAMKDEQQQLQEKTDTIKQNGSDLAEQIAQLQSEQAEAIQAGTAHDKLDLKIENTTKAIEANTKNLNDNTGAYAELEGQIDDVREALSNFGGLMKAQEGMMGQLEQWQNAVPAVTPLQALAREAATAQDQIESLTAAQKIFNTEHAGQLELPAVVGMNAKFNDWIQDAQDRLKAANNPVRNAMAERLTEQLGGIHGAQNLATASDYGIDPAAKLLQQRDALTRDLAASTERLQHVQAGSLEQAELTGRLQQEQATLYQTALSLAERRAAVERDIKQLAIDQNKEFMRSAFGDGPAALLQKLAAFRMAFNGDGSRKSPLGQGAFFGLSPEMRRNYGMLDPKYNPQMIELQNERNRLNRSQNDWKKPNLGLASPAVPGAEPRPATGLYSAKPIEDATVQAAASIRKSGTELGSVLAAVAKNIKDTFMAGLRPGTAGVVTGGQLPSNPQAGGVGGSRGFSSTAKAGLYDTHLVRAY